MTSTTSEGTIHARHTPAPAVTGAAARKPARSMPARRTHLAPVPQPSVRDAVADMPDEHVQCRDFGHSWRPHTARATDNGCYKSVLRCSRCLTERTRLLGPRGQVLSTSYDYADKYLVHGLGRLTGTDRDVLRLASVQRLIGGGS